MFCERTGAHARLFYRHRRRNEGRKAGNVADWVKRFGARYECMVVLDADSLMSGATLARLAAAMDARPRAGLIQTLPVIVNGSTLFARLQQFAAAGVQHFVVQWACRREDIDANLEALAADVLPRLRESAAASA